MHVRDLMTRTVQTCTPDDTLSRAAQIMWERDCGCVPVADSDGKLVGIVTDRDICMAAYTQGTPLSQCQVGSAMSKEVYSCRGGDRIDDVEALMTEKKVRRVPVVDKDNRVIGIVALGDLARFIQRGVIRRATGTTTLLRTLAAVSEPRPAREEVAATAAAE
jgi:CBS domain-containing protein